MPLKPKRPGRPSALHVTLTDTERHLIHAWLRSTTIATGQARRARAVLLLADGRPLSQVAAMVGVARNSVYKYAARFLAQGVDGLRDRPQAQAVARGEGTTCLPCCARRPPGRSLHAVSGRCPRRRTRTLASLADLRGAGAGGCVPRVQAQAARLYAAYVAGLGPLGLALPPWQDLIDRQQYAWRCVARAGEEETLTHATTRCAYCEAAPAIVRCGEISDAWEGEPLCGACWGLVLADPDDATYHCRCTRGGELNDEPSHFLANGCQKSPHPGAGPGGGPAQSAAPSPHPPGQAALEPLRRVRRGGTVSGAAPHRPGTPP